jgi:CxxC motif-containing protein
MEKRELTCIGCPLGCAITVEMKDGEILQISGQTCKRGEEYARKEVTNPTRIVTSIVHVNGGRIPMVSVKTKSDIPKNKIFECTKALQEVCVEAPVHIGDVILENVAGTGVSIVATKNVEAL